MKHFSHYSAAMDADLNALEDKLGQLIDLCRRQRMENIKLRQELAQAQSDLRQLKDNMARASERLEALLATLPEGAVDE